MPEEEFSSYNSMSAVGHAPGTGERHEESPTAAQVLLYATDNSSGLGERTPRLLAVASEKVRPA